MQKNLEYTKNIAHLLLQYQQLIADAPHKAVGYSIRKINHFFLDEEYSRNYKIDFNYIITYERNNKTQPFKLQNKKDYLKSLPFYKKIMWILLKEAGFNYFTVKKLRQQFKLSHFSLNKNDVIAMKQLQQAINEIMQHYKIEEETLTSFADNSRRFANHVKRLQYLLLATLQNGYELNFGFMTESAFARNTKLKINMLDTCLGCDYLYKYLLESNNGTDNSSRSSKKSALIDKLQQQKKFINNMDVNVMENLVLSRLSRVCKFNENKVKDFFNNNKSYGDVSHKTTSKLALDYVSEFNINIKFMQQITDNINNLKVLYKLRNWQRTIDEYKNLRIEQLEILLETRKKYLLKLQNKEIFIKTLFYDIGEDAVCALNIDKVIFYLQNYFNMFGDKHPDAFMIFYNNLNGHSLLRSQLIMILIKEGLDEVVKILLSQMQQQDKQKLSQFINSKFNLLKDNIYIPNYDWQQGFDISRDEEFTPLGLAARCGRLSIVKLLIEQYNAAAIDETCIKPNSSSSPVAHAKIGALDPTLSMDHQQVIDYLLNKGIEGSRKQLLNLEPVHFNL